MRLLRYVLDSRTTLGAVRKRVSTANVAIYIQYLLVSWEKPSCFLHPIWQRWGLFREDKGCEGPDVAVLKVADYGQSCSHSLERLKYPQIQAITIPIGWISFWKESPNPAPQVLKMLSGSTFLMYFGRTILLITLQSKVSSRGTLRGICILWGTVLRTPIQHIPRNSAQ